MLHHRAFDAGLITIGDDMAVQVSRKYPSGTGDFFSNAVGRFHGSPITLPEKFRPNPEFLAYHRERIFQD